MTLESTYMLKKNWPALIALLAIIGLLTSTRGGLASLAPFARILIPIVVIWLLFKWFKRALRDFAIRTIQGKTAGQMSAFHEFLRRNADPMAQNGNSGAGIVDLCPKCGAQIDRAHRC
jgi:hypothetical protein